MKKQHRLIWLVLLLGAGVAVTWWVQRQTCRHQVSAWLPLSAGESGRASFTENLDSINEINFFWYLVQPDGRVTLMGVSPPHDLLERARVAGLRIVPTVINDFDPDRVAQLIGDSDSRAAHVQTLLDLVLAEGYDGIEIDYESLDAEMHDEFSLFIEQLAQALHREKKWLSIAVHAKTAPPGTWSGPQAQDWRRLGRAVDAFKIMTYDYHWSTSEAGPISPPEWIDQVLDYAETVVPPRKIWMGVPLYGYIWSGQLGRGLTWSEMERHAQLYRAQPTHDAETGEKTFSYRTSQGEQYVAYYNDAQSIAVKLDILLKRHPRIAGISLWRLGGEDPAVWPLIRAKF